MELRFHVYSGGNDLHAIFARPCEAAILVAVLGEHTTIRDGTSRDSIVWYEGREEQPASESYDFVAETAWSRV